MTKPEDSYRESVVAALKNLIQVERQIFTSAIIVLMSSEWKDIDEAFDVGDYYEFSLPQLESSTDPNVKGLVESIRTLRSNAMTLQNLNKISDEELERD